MQIKVEHGPMWAAILADRAAAIVAAVRQAHQYR